MDNYPAQRWLNYSFPLSYPYSSYYQPLSLPYQQQPFMTCGAFSRVQKTPIIPCVKKIQKDAQQVNQIKKEEFVELSFASFQQKEEKTFSFTVKKEKRLRKSKGEPKQIQKKGKFMRQVSGKKLKNSISLLKRIIIRFCREQNWQWSQKLEEFESHAFGNFHQIHSLLAQKQFKATISRNFYCNRISRQVLLARINQQNRIAFKHQARYLKKIFLTHHKDEETATSQLILTGE